MQKLNRGRFFVLFFVVAFSFPGKAAVFNFATVETSTVDSVFRTLATSFAFRPVEPASDLGVVWGLNVGVGASGTDLSQVSNSIQGLTTNYLPNADVQLGIGIPAGLTFELGAIPKVSISGTTIAKYSGAVKWTVNRLILKKLPISLAVRGFYGQTEINFSEAMNGGTVDVTYNTAIYGGQLVLSRYIGFLLFGFEPYVSAGFISHTSTITGTGTATIFGNTYPAGTASAAGNEMASSVQAGVLIKLGVLGIAGEYNRAYGINSYAFKTSFIF